MIKQTHIFYLRSLLGICHLMLASESRLSFVLPKAQLRVTTRHHKLQVLKSTKNNGKDALDSEQVTYYLDQNGRPVDHHKSPTLLGVPIHNSNNSMSTTFTSKMINLQTPHSGRKFRPTHPATHKNSTVRSFINKISFRNNRRFTEGWYYRLTLPQYNESFVFIFSIEDAGRYVRGNSSSANLQKRRSKLDRLKRLVRREKVKSPLTLACMQLLGPQDTYLVQSDDDDTKFWGWKYAQGLGCTFEWIHNNHTDIAAMSPEEWREKVQTGFQILPFHFQGRLSGHDGTMGGVKANQGIPGCAEYDFEVRPVAGWGNYPPLSSSVGSESNVSTTANDDRQFSTAGWLANYPVFEPHWQITMANARASGTLYWNGTKYTFEDAPFYGEKNWGGAFPTKWYWAQCNSFDNHPDLAFTAGGGIRQLPFSFLPGKKTETLGLIGIHHNGTFYEIVPWTGQMNWKVWPWGRWEFRGRCTNEKGKLFEAEVIAITDLPGVQLRAPTKDKGMQYFCRDSGFGNVTMSLWLLDWDKKSGSYVRQYGQPIIHNAQSKQCAVEIGGGPWHDVWAVTSKMSKPLKWMVRLPYTIRNAFR